MQPPWMHDPRVSMGFEVDTVLQKEGLDAKALAEECISYCAQGGLLLASSSPSSSNQKKDEPHVLFTHAPVSLLPNDFPVDQYLRAVELAPLFNRLVDEVAADGPWMLEVLRSVLPHDDFTRKLVEIYHAVDGKGLAKQHIHLGINRSDYMLHGESFETSKILQVEINTIASSFGCLSTKVTGLHQYLVEKVLKRPLKNVGPEGKGSYIVPSNCAIEGLARGISVAHREYIRQRGIEKGGAAVLMVVQPGERNVMDQKMLEIALWELHQVRMVRATLRQVAQTGVLLDEKKAGQGPVLMLARKRDDDNDDDVTEVSVAYFRAGYTPTDYPSPLEWDGRVLLERSMTIKCPCISYHLAGTKKVQEALSRPGQLERFVPDAKEAGLLRSCFAGLYGLEEGNVEGALALQVALERPKDFVLKPQREGGGNNLYGQEMVDALTKMTPEELAAFILMERIKPPEQNALLVRDGRLIEGVCVYELGVYGVFVGGGVGKAPLLNKPFGHLLRTKLSSSNEGGVAAGFAVLSSPILVGDMETAKLDLLPPDEDYRAERRGLRAKWPWWRPALEAAALGSAFLLGLGLVIGVSQGSKSASMFRRDSVKGVPPL